MVTLVAFYVFAKNIASSSMLSSWISLQLGQLNSYTKYLTVYSSVCFAITFSTIPSIKFICYSKTYLFVCRALLPQ